jgi:hypothetical protein
LSEFSLDPGSGKPLHQGDETVRIEQIVSRRGKILTDASNKASGLTTGNRQRGLDNPATSKGIALVIEIQQDVNHGRWGFRGNPN